MTPRTRLACIASSSSLPPDGGRLAPLAAAAVLALAAALCAPGARAQTATPAAPANPASPAASGPAAPSAATSAARTGTAAASRVDRNDREFVHKAARGGMAEVELAKIAQQRAGDAQVRAFAERMVADHGGANAELAALAARKGIADLPREMDGGHKRSAERLQRLSGAAFDRAFMRQMIDDHRKAVAEFDRAARRNGGDADIKAFAAGKLPTLREHLRHAEGMRGGSAASAPGRGASGPR